jgi:hypothetical protein
MLTKKLWLLLDERAGGHIRHLLQLLKENGNHAIEELQHVLNSSR